MNGFVAAEMAAWDADIERRTQQRIHDSQSSEMSEHHRQAVENLHEFDAAYKRLNAKHQKLQADYQELSEAFEQKDRQADASSMTIMRMESEQKLLAEDNALNFAEKKAMYEYALHLRASYAISPIMDPLLSVGSEGNELREKIRDAARRVWRSGGSEYEAAIAARHVISEYTHRLFVQHPLGTIRDYRVLLENEGRRFLENQHEAGNMLDVITTDDPRFKELPEANHFSRTP